MSAVVITGARGYIGSALTKRLASEGHALRLVSRSPSAFEGWSVPNAEYHAADLRDPRRWFELLRGVDAVVHLSSHTDLRIAEADPLADEDFNLRPIRALIEVVHRAENPPRIIFASTATIAGWDPQIPVNEATPDCPCSVYDRHKLEGEKILHEATTGGAVRACSLRLSNVYGNGGASINVNRGVLNIMMKHAIDGEPLTLYGGGRYLRDFIHIDDVVEAFLRALATQDICDGGHYVIASGRGHTLAEAYGMIAEAALELLQRRVKIVHAAEPPDLHQIERRNFVGDSRVFCARTGWWPAFDLRAGILDYFVRTASPVTAP